MDTTQIDVKELCVRSVHIMANGTMKDFEAIVHPEARNREDVDEPPASRGRGPAAFYATALWLREAYAELAHEIHDVVAEGNLVVMHTTMSGRHTGTFVAYDADARPAQAFPPTGKRFATTQTHWFRVADGKVIEHWANRDDLGTATQLGWAPPSPLYMIKMFLATRKARREARRFVLAGYGSGAGAWTAYVLSIPFMVFVLPYFLGAVLLRSEVAEPSLRVDDLAADTTGVGVVRETK